MSKPSKCTMRRYGYGTRRDATDCAGGAWTHGAPDLPEAATVRALVGEATWAQAEAWIARAARADRRCGPVRWDTLLEGDA